MVDDPCSNRNTQTPHQRQKVINWFQRDLLPRLDHGGQIIVDATRAVVRLENRFAEALKRVFREIKNAVADKLPELRPETIRPKLEDAPDEISLELEESLKLNASRVATGVADSMKDSLRQALIEGISAGETIPQLMRRIEGQLDSVAAVNVRPVTDVLGRVLRAGHIRRIAKETAAETIARTEANRAFNLGNLDALEQTGVGEVIWLLASDACPICRRLSESLPGVKAGRTLTLEEARDLIPAHPNCRCSVITETGL